MRIWIDFLLKTLFILVTEPGLVMIFAHGVE